MDCDIRELPLGDETVDEIAAIHVVEHFFITEIKSVLIEWQRVLKSGGKLIIELPCWDKVQTHIKAESPENFTRWALYGEPRTHKDGVPALHKWCWSMREMHGLLDHLGFTDIKSETPLFHQPSRDMRFVATK
jgi:predicted SAM-dependent methyltransferase